MIIAPDYSVDIFTLYMCGLYVLGLITGIIVARVWMMR